MDPITLIVCILVALLLWRVLPYIAAFALVLYFTGAWDRLGKHDQPKPEPQRIERPY